jgi:hypothetical protein
MIRVSASEFSKEVAHFQELALKEPVVVTHDGRDRTVVISADEYQRLRRRDRQVFAAGELPDDIVDALASAKMDPRHEHLNELLEDWPK